MANFTFIIGDGPRAGSAVAWVEAKDDKAARDLAREWLAKSDHLTKIEVHRGEAIFVVKRIEPNFLTYPAAS